VLNKLRNDDGFVEGWIGLLMLNAAAAAFVEGAGADSASNEPVARLETDCRREVEGVVIGCWARVGGVVGVVGPVGRLNMAFVVGRSAAPKGVERKSEGRSIHVNIIWRYGKSTGDRRNAPLIHGGIDPPVKNPKESFVKEL
jgi:hypothetical protein